MLPPYPPVGGWVRAASPARNTRPERYDRATRAPTGKPSTVMSVPGIWGRSETSIPSSPAASRTICATHSVVKSATDSRRGSYRVLNSHREPESSCGISELNGRGFCR